jgi:hypothetical protein
LLRGRIELGKERQGEGRTWGGAGRQGRAAKAGLDRVGPQRGTKTHDTHNHRSESNREMKYETILSKTHD